jgi:hypothetical protein
MYMYSISLFSINVVSLHPGISREDVIIVLFGGSSLQSHIVTTNPVNQNANPVFGAVFLSHSDKLSLHHAVGV